MRNFSNSDRGAGGGRMPAIFLCAEVSGRLGRHRSLRANRHKLAEAPFLCDGCGRRAHADGHTHAGISGISDGDLLAGGENGAGSAIVGDE